MTFLKIDTLEIYWWIESLTEEEDKLIFNLDVTKPINVFCLENGSGKSTLFLILRSMITLSGPSQSLIEICERKNNEKIIIKKINLILKIWEDKVEIIYIYWGNMTYLINDERKTKMDIEQLYYDRVFNQQKYLLKLLDDWSTIRKTTLLSLSRSFFFWDDTYYHKTEDKSCNLIDNHKDWSYEKMIFFYYLLGEDLDWIDEHILSMTGKYTEASEKLSNINTKLKQSWYDFDQDDSRLLDPMKKYKEYANELALLEKDYRWTKYLLCEAMLAVEKIKSLLGDSNDKDIKGIIQNEINELEKYIIEIEYTSKKLQNKMESRLEDTNLLSEIDNLHEIWDLLKKKFTQEDILKNNELGKTYLENHKEREILLKNFQNIYKKLLKFWWYNNAEIKMDLKIDSVWDLKLKLKKGAKLWDWHLRATRILILTGLQLYKAKYQQARLPWLVLFDAAMDWVTNKNIIIFFRALINYIREFKVSPDIQLFYFFAKSSVKDNEIEEFLALHNDLVYVHKIKEEKIFNLSWLI